MKFSTLTLGCKANQFDTFSIENQLLQIGYEKTDHLQNSDIAIINTCSVTHIAERKSRLEIRKLKKHQPRTKLIVVGCYAELSPEKIKALPEVDLVIGQKEKLQISDWGILEPGNHSADHLILAEPDIRFNLKIQDGCQLMCSYCSIPFSRGKHLSTSLSEVESLAKQLVAKGVRELILTGINLGAYGFDRKHEKDLNDVLKALTQIPELIRIRISSIELRYVNERLLETWLTHPKICNHFHIPLQAAHDQTLKAMQRKYDLEDYFETIQKIRKNDPRAAITTDLMPGFPGETDEIFNQSLKNIQELNFSRIHVFPFSKRKGTPAFDMENQVEPQVLDMRVHQLLRLGHEMQKKYAQKFLGSPLDLLVESFSDDQAVGYSANYLKGSVPRANLKKGDLIFWTPTAITPELSLI